MLAEAVNVKKMAPSDVKREERETRRWSLRKKFLIYVLILILLLMGGVFFVIEKNNRSVILSEWQKRGLSNTMYLAALSTSPLLMYDYAKLEQNVDKVAEEPDVVYALILDWMGKVLAHSERDELIGQSLGDSVSQAAAATNAQLIQEYYDRERGEEIWDISYPIYQSGRKWGVVRIGFSKKSLHSEIARNRRDILILSIVAMIIAGAATSLLAERISRPIRMLSEGALSISRGKLDQQITIETGDEIEELSDTFNRMTRELAKNRDRQKKLIRELSQKNLILEKEIAVRERLEEEIIKIERLRALGEMSSGVAHDFNNILGTILGRAQLLIEKVGNFSERRNLQIIEKAALDGAETVRRIQEFTRMRADSSQFEPMDLNEIINDVVEFTRTRWKNEAQARGINIEVEKTFLPIPLFTADPSGLREVFTNLIINAVDAMPKGGTIHIETSWENETAVVTVKDTGVGMSTEVCKRIFEPFFTTKGKGGNGLGLAMCYGIIMRHRGKILCHSQEGRGTTFTVLVPMDLTSHGSHGVNSVHTPITPAKILVIDDDEEMRSVLSDILRQSGCQVENTGSGREGFKNFSPTRYDIVISDLGMEEMTGWEIARRVKAESPSTAVALITGWGSQLEEEVVRERGVDFVVSKPFRIEEVKQLVNRAMELKRKISGSE